jgi:hypothetical protein
MKGFNFDNKTFSLVQNSENGSVDTETIFILKPDRFSKSRKPNGMA